MYTALIILILIVCFLLALVVLAQNPKGGGLASNFSQGNTLFGVEKTTNVVEKITWGGALLLVVISLIAASYNSEKTKAPNRAKANTEQGTALPDVKAGK